MTHPTGTQYEIKLGEQRAVVTELGAGLRHYSVADRSVLRGYDVDAAVSGGCGQQLIPWPNRIRDGRYPWAGADQQLVLTEPKRHNASHGLVRYVPWTVIEHEPAQVKLGVRVFPQPGWPGILAASLLYALSESGLTVTMEATNLGSQPFPFGYGAHPYLSVGEASVDEVSVTVPGNRYLRVDDRLLPVELDPVEGSELDLRGGTPLGSRVLDTAYTDLDRDADGGWHAELALGERWAELWADASFDWVQVFSGEHRRDVGIALEPMTCGPDAFNPGPTRSGRRELAPQETFRCRWGMRGR